MNKTFKTIGKAIVSLAAVALAFSCAKEVPGNEVKEGFSVQMGITVPEFVSVNTKAISESAIKDVTVLEFKAGVLINQFTLSDQIFTSGSLDIAANFDTDDKKALPAAKLNEETGYLVKDGAENILVFLANFDCNSLLPAPALTLNTSTYADFLAASMAFADADALANAAYVPMYGTWNQGLSIGATNYLRVTLAPVMSYINFTVNTTNFAAPAGQVLVGSPTISNMELHNVPLGLSLPVKAVRPEIPVNNANGVWYEKAVDGGYNVHTFDAADAYPTTGFVNVDKTLEAAQITTPSATSFKFYFNETCQGSYDAVTTFEEKAAATYANRPYITFDLTYTTEKGSSMVFNYSVNLGGNNTGDFNLLGGVKYNVTTYIYGANDAKTYITFDDAASFNLESVAAAVGYEILPLANCYMLPTGADADATKVLPLTQALAGWKYIQDNDGSGLDYVTALKSLIEAGNYTVETEWQTMANGSTFNPNAPVPANADHLINGGGSFKYFPILSIPAVPATNGSALIVLKAMADEAPFISGDILWSWHLWFTNYAPDDVDGSAITGQGVVTAVTNGETHRYKGGAFAAGGAYPNGLGMMDRNLGATYDASTTAIKDAYTGITTTSDANFRALRGLYYQFGRPAPFPIATADAGDINTAVAYTNTGVAYTFVNEVDATQTPHQKDAATNGSDLKYATLHPTHFISNQTIWNDAQSTTEAWPKVMDPSPAGWSLPKASTNELENVWWDFGTSDNKYDGAAWNTSNKGASYEVATGTSTYYPASGYVNRTTGKFSNVGSSGYYWSQSPYGNTNGRLLSFYSSALNRSNNYGRADAFPVRCVQD